MISCRICQGMTHYMGRHLDSDHPEWSLEDYQRHFPEAPLYSDAFWGLNAQDNQSQMTEDKRTLQEVFSFKNPVLNARQEPIKITIPKHCYPELVPKPDHQYIFDIEKLKSVLFGLEHFIPIYVWGPAGTGKTALIRNIAAFTNRPFYRVQHTLNMIESDVLGDWRVRDGETYFELGPLPLAMQGGWLYLADEYDRAPPGVVSLYQAVLEGEPLILKEAPAEMRCVQPHPNFRICATGNTTGLGDESGLYAGTVVQDAANYSRFGVTEYIGYMDKDSEVGLVCNKLSVREQDACNLVDWANRVRERYDSGQMTSTVGPRELLYAARIGAHFYDFRRGLRTAIINRMSQSDREIAEQLSQRYFG